MISKRSFSTLICAALGVPLDMAAALQEQDAQETLSALSSSNATFFINRDCEDGETDSCSSSISKRSDPQYE
jgi:hypothetical protein